MKGVINVAHSKQRFVYHAVHMIASADFTDEWAEGEDRTSKLVFIGKDLDRAELQRDFEACLSR